MFFVYRNKETQIIQRGCITCVCLKVYFICQKIQSRSLEIAATNHRDQIPVAVGVVDTSYVDPELAFV